MKKRRNAFIQLGILLALGLAVVLTLALPQMAGNHEVARNVEVSVIIRESDSSLWSNARLGMEQAAAELGGELRFLTLTEDNSTTEQEQLLRREAEGGADVLVVIPADGVLLSQQRKELVGARPVVAVESVIEGALCTVAPDNEALGRALAQAVREDWTQGVVLLLDTAPKSSGVAARHRAARVALEEAGVPVASMEIAVEDIPSKLKASLRRAGITQIIAFEPAATESAAQAKQSDNISQGLYGVGVTGSIAAWLERGTVSAVAAWSDYAVGYLAVERAIRSVGRVIEAVEPLPFSVVRGEDIYDPDNQKLLFPVTS